MEHAETNALRAPNSLPADLALLRWLVDAIGLDASLTLVKSFGGTSIPIVKGVSRSGDKRREALVTLLGQAAADKLIALCGGERLYIPLGRRGLVAERNQRMQIEYRTLREQALPSTEAARLLGAKYSLSDRQVWNVLKAVTQEKEAAK